MAARTSPRPRGAGFRPMHFDLFARARGVSRFDFATIDANVAFVDQAPDSTARNGREFGAQIGVEPLGGERFFDGEDFSARSTHSLFAGCPLEVQSSLTPEAGTT